MCRADKTIFKNIVMYHRHCQDRVKKKCYSYIYIFNLHLTNKFVVIISTKNNL